MSGSSIFEDICGVGDKVDSLGHSRFSRGRERVRVSNIVAVREELRGGERKMM